MSEENKAVPVAQVLGDYSHPAHEPVMEAALQLQSGELNLCACLGAFPGEPYCPCQMTRRGLPPSPARQKAMAEADANRPAVLAALHKAGIIGRPTQE